MKLNLNNRREDTDNVRSRLILMMILLLLVFVSACSQQEEQQIESQVQETTEQSETASEPEEAVEEDKVADEAQATEEENTTRTYTHMAGTSEIPVKPERVVTDWYYGHLVVLGVKPVGTDSFVWKNHPFIEQEGTDEIGQSFEKVIELEPDLIIPWGANRYEEFSKVAPTVPLELNGGPLESVKTFGEILGRQEEAQAWIDKFEADAAQYQVQIQEAIDPSDTFTIFNAWKGTMRVYGDVNMGGYALYHALNLSAPEAVQQALAETDQWYVEIALEAIPDYAGDHIILTVYDPDGTSTVLEDLQNSGWWNGLEAVKAGQVHQLDYNSLYFDDPIALENQIRILTEAITSK